MNEHTATEVAYKNGYAQGKADAAKKIEDLEGDLEVWKQNRFNIFQTTECYERARRQAAGEIFEEFKKEYGSLAFLDNVLAGHIQLFITKIKRKYMQNATDTNVGGETECQADGKGEWTNIAKDGFPKEEGEYFVWDAEQRKREIRFFFRLPPNYPVETYPEVREYFGNCADYKKITHWMPLPEPPKGE